MSARLCNHNLVQEDITMSEIIRPPEPGSETIDQREETGESPGDIVRIP